MFELKGKNNICKVFTDNCDSETISQLSTLLNQDSVIGSKIRIMPDTHAGKGCVIGTTMTIKDTVIPNLVGVDIGCFTSDTKVSLADGRSLSFLELIQEHKEGKVNYGYCVDKNNHIQIGKLEYPRLIKKVNKLAVITLDNNEEIKCTLDHLIMLRNGEYIEASKLSAGDSLMPVYIKLKNELGDNYFNNRFMDELADHKCIYDPASNKYKFIHFLSDEYNIRHSVYIPSKKESIRHHKDFHKHNNNPDNIERVTYKAHWKIHADNIKYTNDIGITGWKRAEQLHPGQCKSASVKRAYQTWHGPNAEKNREALIKRTKYGFANYEEQRNRARIRQLANNTNTFNTQNRDAVFIICSKLSKIKKILNHCLENYNSINEDNYEKSRLNFYNGITYNNALAICRDNGLSVNELLTRENLKDYITNKQNHKVKSVNIINVEEEPVYCLTNHEFSNFALSAGVIVHNCGMLALKLGTSKIDLDQLDQVIRKYVPSGFSIHERAICEFDFSKMVAHVNVDRAEKSIGTLGGGNHFIEVNRGSDDLLWLVIHTGSRHLGTEVCKHYQDLAYNNIRNNGVQKKIEETVAKLKKEGKEHEIENTIKVLKMQTVPVPKDLCYLEGEDLSNYLNDMKIAQEFAYTNRKYIARSILSNMGLSESVLKSFQTIHNYIDTDKLILRKGAVSSELGEELIIPMNMRDGSLICIGKGNEDWNCSAPHGAGRLMSRSQAKDRVSLEEFEKSMEGIYTTCVSTSTIDESPMAYKPMDEIILNVKDTVDIIECIKPIYNYKAN